MSAAKLVTERGIDARELEVGVLGNEDPIASVVGEILPGADVTIPKERTRTVQQFHPMLTRASDLGVALWKQGASLYVLTAPLGEDELAQLYLKVRTHTS